MLCPSLQQSPHSVSLTLPPSLPPSPSHSLSLTVYLFSLSPSHFSLLDIGLTQGEPKVAVV